jgi:hypothetical protein
MVEGPVLAIPGSANARLKAARLETTKIHRSKRPETSLKIAVHLYHSGLAYVYDQTLRCPRQRRHIGPVTWEIKKSAQTMKAASPPGDHPASDGFSHGLSKLRDTRGPFKKSGRFPLRNSDTRFLDRDFFPTATTPIHPERCRSSRGRAGGR